ncbi:Transcriptional regulatory protein sin3 [Tulasnella sp. 419]|nr:Transcriptional regulatory protein sin3 [Tulasnella sp. 419]
MTSLQRPRRATRRVSSNADTTTTTHLSSNKTATPKTPDATNASETISARPRPLAVADALFYLEMVKIRFRDQPEVYSLFLDLMKDFKSGIIDTPTLMDRASTLFIGNPVLINGFNIFLPQGYRIEYVSHHGLVDIITPYNTTTHNADKRKIPDAASHRVHNDLTPGSRVSIGLSGRDASPGTLDTTLASIPKAIAASSNAQSPVLPPFDEEVISSGDVDRYTYIRKFDLSGKIDQGRQVSWGSYSDIWRGTLSHENECVDVSKAVQLS